MSAYIRRRNFRRPAELCRHRSLYLLFRAASPNNPIGKREIQRVTRLKGADVEEALEKLQHVKLIQAQWVQGRRGPAYYRYVAVGSVPRKPKKTTWSGTVLDLGVKESICWDIYELVEKGVAQVGYARETDVIRKFKNKQPPDGSGKYGGDGVRAHIDDMIEGFFHLVRLDKKEARKLLGGPRSAGPVPWLLVLGRRPVWPLGRVRARPWAQTRRAARALLEDGPFSGPTARDKRGSGGVIPDEYDDGVVEMDETPDPGQKHADDG